MEDIHPDSDQYEAPAGRVLDAQLSEHQAEGWLEGYVLTGRHGLFASYEAFLRVVDSMLTQHFKWLRKANELDWRKSTHHLTLSRLQLYSNKTIMVIPTKIQVH